MAQALLRHHLGAADLHGRIEVESAGTFAQVGTPASSLAVAVLEEAGIEMGEHLARQLDAQLLEKADLVLVMEESHRRSVMYQGPAFLGKTYLLSELSGVHRDIPDPYGKDTEAYRRALTLIRKFIDDGWEILLDRLNVEMA